MSAGVPELPDFSSLRRGAFTYFPVAPGRLEFAAAVREKILAERPAVVAVELPAHLEPEYRAALDRLPQVTAIVYPGLVDPEDNIYVLVEPTDPFIEALRTAHEIGAQVVLIDPAVGERPHLPDDFPDPYAIRYLGLERYLELYRLEPQPRSDETAIHAGRLAWKLQGADPFAPTLIVLSLNLLDPVLDAMEQPQDPPAKGRGHGDAILINPHPECLAEICVEMPFLHQRYERHRLAPGPQLIDRGAVQLALLKEAEKDYLKNTGDKITHWQRRMMARYTRNLAQVSGYLTASLFELTVAARGIVDDNYAWEVWNTANRSLQSADSDLETANLSASEIWINTRKLKIRRRLPRAKGRARPANLKMRRKERERGEWARSATGNSICSYPPEDLVIEGYGRFIKNKARSLLSEERSRVHPFTTSILDGIDIRETIRNWHQKKIWVRESDRVAGDFGSVVVIFDQANDERYSYLTTWLGEHQNESDMAFYSTPPFDHMVGPGIGRGEYGGFLMTLPARRLYDIWADPDYDFAENKAERLLMAALDYSVERNVVYVAPKPPRSIFRSIAAQLGRRIAYIPLGQLNPTQLKKVRVVHVLDSHERRESAKEYIW